MNYLERFKVVPGVKVKLKDIDPSFKDHHESHKAAKEEIEYYQTKLLELKERLYAEHRRSLLICLQAMDTGGKDGTINHVLASMNPQGCRVVGFKQPSAEEAAHDILWRIHRSTPAKGEVAIFNRSHFEDVLVLRVHKQVPEAVWSRRYDRIAFETVLAEDGTHILKFYLHISKDEQLKRFKDRLDDRPSSGRSAKQITRSGSSGTSIKAAYEDALCKCSTEAAPWFIIPADHKWFRNLAVARILVEYVDGLGMTFPPPPVDLKHIRKEYHLAKKA